MRIPFFMKPINCREKIDSAVRSFGCAFVFEITKKAGCSSGSVLNYSRLYNTYKFGSVLMICANGVDWRVHPFVKALDALASENCGKNVTVNTIIRLAWRRVYERNIPPKMIQMALEVLRILGYNIVEEECYGDICVKKSTIICH